MVFLVLLVIPLLIAVASFIWSQEINWKEFLSQVGLQVIIAASSAAIIYFGSTHDTEVWNGVVTAKEQNTVSCSHSYQCNPHSCNCDSKGNNCSTCYDTCYEHFNDYDWDVHTSNGELVTIDRIDRQGTMMPPRWKAVKIGEPTSLTHSYTNYVKAAPDSLFRHQGLKEKYLGSIPEYPQNVYDYYRLDRLVLAGVSVPDARAWNADLTKINSELGAHKQVNVIVLLTNKPRDYFYAVEESWIGGKKNDVVLTIGVDQDMKPQWSEVMAWTTDQTFQVKLRDAAMSQETVTREKTVDLLYHTTQKHFKRKPMADFEYLAASISPSPLQFVLGTLFGVVSAVGLAWVFHLYDPFGDAQRTTRYRKPFRVARYHRVSVPKTRF